MFSCIGKIKKHFKRKFFVQTQRTYILGCELMSTHRFVLLKHEQNLAMVKQLLDMDKEVTLK